MIRLIDDKVRFSLCRKARESGRRRAHHNIHCSADDGVQRLLIALQPGTYVPVHRHPLPSRWELVTLLQGSMDCLLFDDTGQVIGRHRFDEEHSCAIEFSPGTWHTVTCLEEDTLIQEVKPGPYDPATASEIAPWCPQEGDPSASAFADWIASSTIGDRYHALG